MGQEVPEVKQGARGLQPIEHAAFQSILAIDGGCSPFIALHLWVGDAAENSSELPFFPSHGYWFDCLGQAEMSCHHLLEWTL